MKTTTGAGDKPKVQQVTDLLVHAIRYAVEQQETVKALRSLAITDELTGLYNRRGFLVLARQQLKVSRRTGRRILLIFADVDGLKQINDAFGHHEGDRVLQQAARVLKKTFRDSDVIARLGGDEFVVLANEAPDETEQVITARLQQNLQALNRKEPNCRLSISVGIAPFGSGRPCSLERLLIEADKAMYAQKRRNREQPVNAA